MQILDMVVANSVCLAENGQTEYVTTVKLSTTEPQMLFEEYPNSSQ